jgi:hypothetical protein
VYYCLSNSVSSLSLIKLNLYLAKKWDIKLIKKIDDAFKKASNLLFLKPPNCLLNLNSSDVKKYNNYIIIIYKHIH